MRPVLSIRPWAPLAAVAAAALLVACADTAGKRGKLGVVPATPTSTYQAGCAGLTAPVPAASIGLPSGGATIDSATLVEAAPMSAAAGGAAPVVPAVPQYCKLLGRIAPVDPQAPPILFQVNLPTQWNGRSVQYGGGGFNGVLITGLGLVPSGRPDQPTPLARGYMTYGTDSGHQNAPGQAPQTFALNDEALENFSHAAYKKVRDVAVALAQRRYGRAPDKLYYVGSSEGGREGLTMAQRYPNDFDGIYSRVPVINWVGLQHAGTRAGLAQMGEGWLPPAQVKRVADAVLAACDAADGLADGVVSDIAGCARRFDPARLRCTARAPAVEGCLSAAQVRTVQTLHARYRYDVPLANGVRSYPGWAVGGGENAPGAGSVGGWRSWQTGSAAATLPPSPSNGIAWVFGSGTLQYLIARDPAFDVRSYRPAAFAARLQAVSRLMDATDPDLRAFAAHGGKLVMLEHTSDYAQSPWAGIEYQRSVQERMGPAATDAFMRLYTAPGVDHVGTGAPANVDMLDVLSQWVEQGKAPGMLEAVRQAPAAPFAVSDARPLCRWPAWPRYRGSGDPALAASFECAAR